MTHYIDGVPIPAIQNINISSSENQEEIDVIEKDNNILFISEEILDDISFDFTLYTWPDATSLTLSEQREKLKQLPRNDVVDNTIKLNGKRGRISVESVNIPQVGSSDTIVEGSLEGKFLPWPKHYPNTIPVVTIPFSGDIQASGSIRSIFSLVSSIEGDLESELESEGYLNVIFNIDGDVKGQLHTFSESIDSFGDDDYNKSGYGYVNPSLNLIMNFLGQADGSLDLRGGIYGWSYGSTYSGTEPILNLKISFEGDIDSNFSATGELRDLTEIGYGNDYGNDYGGLIFGYSSGVYGFDTYEG